MCFLPPIQNNCPLACASIRWLGLKKAHLGACKATSCVEKFIVIFDKSFCWRMHTIYEDDDLLVINKPSGVASQGNDTNTNRLQTIATLQDAFLVHRLDQRVCGLMVLAKNKESLTQLNRYFQTGMVQKNYRAIVGQLPPLDTDTLVHWLKKDTQKAKSKAFTTEVNQSKKAVLVYERIQSSQRYHLLQIALQTGRFHQIRAQLSAIGCPIAGDIKYGFPRTLADGSILLQSYALQFAHPRTQMPL